MANPEHLAILEQGVDVWNKWRKRNPHIRPDLTRINLANGNYDDVNFFRADLTEATLHGRFIFANFSKAILVRSNLSDAILIGALIERANLNSANLAQTVLGNVILRGADLTRAELIGVQLDHAILEDSNLSRANLTSASVMFTNLIRTNLDGTNFDGAVVGFSTFANMNLSAARELDTIIHIGNSTIGIDTIFRSGGNIPEVFLRGCGVPDEIIDLNCVLREKHSPYFTTFISHSSKDKRFCERLYADLQAKNVRTWYFPEDAKWGEPVWGEIDRSIKIYDKLVVVCSKNSLTSGPVLREIERALNREDKERKQILFPIRIDDYLFDEWEHPRKADVLAKVVGDFRGWNRSAANYDAAFKKLLKALQT
ncbi:MAG: toll/interleukin-1 receptor domain-containing protein [Chloroflexota bacterium]|nr:MAG: toll/interleukin-1 receptor domain-containing protein [Chloroflexota bacterium]